MGVGEPVLWDKRFEDIYSEALDRIRETNPDYTALLPADPGITILDAHLYILQRLGEKLNLLPHASLIAWVNYLGVKAKLPTPAKATVVVEFEEPLPEQLIIQKGTRFISEEGITFLSTEEVVAPAGSTQVSVPLECEEKGSSGNVPAYHINNTWERLPYVKSIYNLQPAAGGYDAEPQEEALDRGRKIIRHLWRAITPDDYEELARSVEGIYKAKAIDRLGEINLYLLSQDGQSANDELIRNVKSFLEDKRISGVSLKVYGAQIKEISVEARVKLRAGATLSQAIAEASSKLGGYINPKGWEWGRKVAVSEVLALLEEVSAVEYVEELILPPENMVLKENELASLKGVVLYAV